MINALLDPTLILTGGSLIGLVVIAASLLLALGLMFGAGALALTPEQALRLVDGGSDDRIEAMSQAVPQGDAAQLAVRRTMQA